MSTGTLGISVELRPHIGQKMTPLGLTEIEHDQWVVVSKRDGQKPTHVGYLPKRAGSSILWLAGRDFPHSLGPMIAGAIEEAAQAERAKLEGAADDN